MDSSTAGPPSPHHPTLPPAACKKKAPETGPACATGFCHLAVSALTWDLLCPPLGASPLGTPTPRTLRSTQHTRGANSLHFSLGVRVVCLCRRPIPTRIPLPCPLFHSPTRTRERGYAPSELPSQAIITRQDCKTARPPSRANTGRPIQTSADSSLRPLTARKPALLLLTAVTPSLPNTGHTPSHPPPAFPTPVADPRSPQPHPVVRITTRATPHPVILVPEPCTTHNPSHHGCDISPGQHADHGDHGRHDP